MSPLLIRDESRKNKGQRGYDCSMSGLFYLHKRSRTGERRATKQQKGGRRKRYAKNTFSNGGRGSVFGVRCRLGLRKSNEGFRGFREILDRKEWKIKLVAH